MSAPMTLPAPRAELFGRSADVDALAARVVSAPGRLVTVTGCGGVGKTSLALAAARHTAPQFADGAAFADLSAVRTADALPVTVAQRLGVLLGSTSEPWGAVASALAERELLLLLDNCEHLVDAVAEAADLLLDSVAGLRLLATSREPLHVGGEETYAVRPLVIPDATETGNREAHETAAVQMFLARAAAGGRDVEWTDANASTVVEICRRLDGIPLALELAATTARSVALADLADRLERDFAVLIAPGRGRTDRQQTMRATLEWSHDLLTGPEQIVFRRLGAFAGSWGSAAAEYVCADDSLDVAVPELIAALVDKSLVVADQLDPEARFRLLMPVQEYARGRLAASGEAERTRDRHCTFFVDEVERAESEIHRADQARWISRLDSDLDNIRLAVRTAQTRGDAERVLRVAGALWWYLWQRGHLREGVGWVDPLLAVDVPAATKLGGLRSAAMWHGALGSVPEARSLATAFYDAAKTQGETSFLAQAATILAVDLQRSGDMAGARPYLEEALEVSRRVGDVMLTGHALVNLGEASTITGDVEAATSLFREGLASFESEGNLWGIAYASHHLAALLAEDQRFDESAELAARAVQLLHELGDRFYLTFAVEGLGRAVLGRGQAASAASLFGVADRLRKLIGAPISRATREEHEATLAQLRAALSSGGLERAWVAGESVPLVRLVDEAIHPPADPGESTAYAGPGGSLTPRELDVVRLLVAGMTNREIADELVITRGTAGVHVEHILRKLDLRSRHQVAEWARLRGLTA